MVELTNEYQYIGRSSAINCPAGYKYYVLLYAKATGDLTAGKHTVTIKERMAGTSAISFYGWPTKGYIKVDEITVTEWNMQPYPNKEWETTSITEGGVTYSRWVDMIEVSTTVDTGYGVAKDIVIDSSWTMQGGDGSNWLPTANIPSTASITVTLPMIATASVPTVSADSVVMENRLTIATNRVSDSFTHTLTYAFGNASGSIAEGVTDRCEWTPHLDLAEQIPNDSSGVCTIYCTTYSGETKVGETQAVPITLKVPDNASTKPKVSMSLSPVSSLAAPFNALYIQNLTKVDAELSADGEYGADIKSYQMVIGNGVYGDPYTSGYLTQTGNVAVTGEAVDSRGYVGRTEQTITVIPYGKPAIVPAEGQTDIVCGRCDENGNFTESGTYLRIIAKRSYSPVVSDGVQNNFCQIQYRVDGGNWIPILAGDADGDEIDTGAISGVVASATTSYTIDIGVVDTIGNDASVTKIVPTDAVAFHLRLGGKGAAFGEYAENEKELSIAADWTLNIKGHVIGAIFDAIYPVDSIYISYGNKNPSELFGGTWEQVTNTAIEGTTWRRIA